MESLLPEQIIQRRKRKNALDLGGHFAHFIGEFVEIMLSCIANLTIKRSLNYLSFYIHVYTNSLLCLTMIAISSSLKTTAQQLVANSWSKLIVQIFAILISSLFVTLCVLVSEHARF
jgi:hypothetical protein